MLSEKLYRALLFAYPREHRHEYGELIVKMFRDRMRREGGGLGILKVWLEMFIDLVTSALKEHSNGGSMTARAWAGNGSTVSIVVWSAMLFFGYRILSELVAGTVILIDFGIDCCWAPPVLWAKSNVTYFIPFTLVVVSYPFVRRLRHDLLSYLWLYLIIVGILGMIAILSVSPVFHSMETVVWLVAVRETVGLVATVWFARKLSAYSFESSLLFIGLTTVLTVPSSFILPQFHADSPIAWTPYMYITLLIGGTLVRGLAVWSLIKVHDVTTSTMSVLLLVLPMVLLGTALNGLVFNVWAPAPVDNYGWVLPMLVVPALAVVLTYAVRVRGPGEPQPGLKLQST